ncbi:MAG: alpha/beta hydrolase [Clostridiales bacterium]|mgnify:FL=1|nr:alpha/beta hydrolase [Clostridiales bacterium]
MWYLIIPAAAAAIILGAAYAVYLAAFRCGAKYCSGLRDVRDTEQHRPYREAILALVDEQASRPYEPVGIISRDGLRLFGKYYHNADGAPLQIMFHGYRSSADRNFCGGMKLCLELGCNALLVDQRAHGQSEGRTLTLGIKERYDCCDWVDYAVKRFGSDVKIILSGISMGAATVLMASDLLPDNVVGIIADSGYTSPEAIVKKVLRDNKLPVRSSYLLVRLAAKIFGRFDTRESRAVDSLSRSKIPVLLIHGEADRFVPCSMALENYNACAGKKRIFTVPGAGHGLSYFGDTAGYSRVVREFVADSLRGGAAADRDPGGRAGAGRAAASFRRVEISADS